MQNPKKMPISLTFVESRYKKLPKNLIENGAWKTPVQEIKNKM